MRDGPAILKTLAGESLALEDVAAKGRIEGLVFELEVEQRYCNRTGTNIEAVYSFPLPRGAALLEIAFEIGGKKLAGVVVERPKAEEKYESAIEEGDSAILLEQVAPGLYTVNLGNLMAGEAAVVRYSYVQLLRFEQGQVRLTVPTVIAPRYGNPAVAGFQPHQAPETDLGAAYSFHLSVDIIGELAAGQIGSPSHAIEIGRSDQSIAVRLARSGYLDRDFVLNIGGLDGRSLTLLARDGNGYVALASFYPPLPQKADAGSINLKILLDCSSSMAGDSVRAAKAALHRIIEQLTSEDRFTLSRFGTHVEHFFPTLVAADDATIGTAATHVAELDADMGGTEMERALIDVFALGDQVRAEQAHDAAVADVLLITDGHIWNAENLIAAAKASGHRVFVIAIGAAPAENMLRRIAEATDGASEFVAPGENAEAAIMRVFGRLRQPRANQLAAIWPTTPEWVVPLPDALFQGETVSLLAGFRQRPIGRAELTYRLEGQTKPQRSSAALPARLAQGDTLPRLAAALRLPSLGPAASTELAVRYQLVTEHTSCVIVHERPEGEKAKSMPELRRVAQMQPAGWGGAGRVMLAEFSTMPGSRDDLFETPAFLRRDMRTDATMAALSRTTQTEITPADFLRQILQNGGWGFFAHSRAPSRTSDLKELGVPEAVLELLRDLVSEGNAENLVIAAFIEALSATPAADAVGRLGRRRLRALTRGASDHLAIREALEKALVGVTRGTWNVNVKASAQGPVSVEVSSTARGSKALNG